MNPPPPTGPPAPAATAWPRPAQLAAAFLLGAAVAWWACDYGAAARRVRSISVKLPFPVTLLT